MSLHPDPAIDAAARAVEEARAWLDEVTDPDLVDAAILELGAAEKRLNYLLRQARKECA